MRLDHPGVALVSLSPGEFMIRYLTLAVLAAALTGCARSEAIRTSANTMAIQTSAAPACGSTGAARVAANTAATETISRFATRRVSVSVTLRKSRGRLLFIDMVTEPKLWYAV